jgi:hypothetical protein
MPLFETRREFARRAQQSLTALALIENLAADRLFTPRSCATRAALDRRIVGRLLGAGRVEQEQVATSPVAAVLLDRDHLPGECLARRVDRFEAAHGT